MAKRVTVTDTRQLPPGQAAAFDVEGVRIAVFNVGGTYYAIDDTCPHAGAPLSSGYVDGTRVGCPWHGADFCLKSGAVLSPPARGPVRTYPVFLQGTDLQVEV